MDLDWRELDPYYNELQDCASFWTFVNLIGDAVYSGLIILSVFLNSNQDSMFFEGIQSHVNPVLMYLILSLLVNYGALKTNQAGYERCFLLFSLVKAFLFPLTFGCFLYLLFVDVQDYFGDFWVSFVVILACYNGISILAIWSMYICNKYIHINEIAQKRHRNFLQNQTLIWNKLNLSNVGNTDSSICSCPHCDKCSANEIMTTINMEHEDDDHELVEDEDPMNNNNNNNDDDDDSFTSNSISSIPSVWTIHGDGHFYPRSLAYDEELFRRHCYSSGDISEGNYFDEFNSTCNYDDDSSLTFDEHLRRLVFGSIDNISNVQVTL